MVQREPQEKVKRILIVNVNWVGDVIFSTPFIRAVREAYPDAYIACLIHPRCREMLESSPRLDELIVYDEEFSHKGLFGKLRLILELRKKHFDIAFLLHRSFTKALITLLAGVKERVGYLTKKRGSILTKAIPEPETGVHKVEYFLALARAYGITPKDNSYEFFVGDSDKRSVEALLAKNGISPYDKIAVICPGGNWDPKRWPKENFARLSDKLQDELGMRVVIAGARKDINLADNIKKRMNKRPVVACGITTLKELGALLARADIVIANDTGPMHMAVAMQARVIALFGPTSSELTGPYGKGVYSVIARHNDCDIPCYDQSCRDHKCMSAITVDDVYKVAKEMLGR
jgi:lipopolysaccharide heptosyltransferase II